MCNARNMFKIHACAHLGRFHDRRTARILLITATVLALIDFGRRSQVSNEARRGPAAT